MKHRFKLAPGRAVLACMAFAPGLSIRADDAARATRRCPR